LSNESAFLSMLRKSEGTSASNGYNILFGGGVFEGFATHPRKFFNYTDKSGKEIRTSAAGAYQITATTFDALNKKYPGKWSDFSPDTQDSMALTLIKERGAMQDIDAGRLDAAIAKCRQIWASLPGTGANQPERSIAYAKDAFTNAGGVLA
jgi:muramidase (phage lysozyme)